MKVWLESVPRVFQFNHDDCARFSFQEAVKVLQLELSLGFTPHPSPRKK